MGACEKWSVRAKVGWHACGANWGRDKAQSRSVTSPIPVTPCAMPSPTQGSPAVVLDGEDAAHTVMNNASKGKIARPWQNLPGEIVRYAALVSYLHTPPPRSTPCAD